MTKLQDLAPEIRASLIAAMGCPNCTVDLRHADDHWTIDIFSCPEHSPPPSPPAQESHT